MESLPIPWHPIKKTDPKSCFQPYLSPPNHKLYPKPQGASDGWVPAPGRVRCRGIHGSPSPSFLGAGWATTLACARVQRSNPFGGELFRHWLVETRVWWRHREWAPFPGYQLALGQAEEPAAPPPPHHQRSPLGPYMETQANKENFRPVSWCQSREKKGPLPLKKKKQQSHIRTKALLNCPV